MQTDDFGSVQYEGQAAEATESQTAAVAVDENDPRLVSEALDDKVEGDAYAVPPPAPDGKWRAKLKLVKIRDTKDKQEKDWIVTSIPNFANGRPFYAVNVEADLIDLSGAYDGTKLTTYWVKSIVDSKSGTSQMTTLARVAGGQPPSRSTDKERCDLLLKTLAAEPEVIVDTFWEASCLACGEAAEKKDEKKPKPFQRGMQRFPQTKPGVYDPSIPCPTCKSLCRAQVRIAQFFSLKDAKPTRGLQ